MNRARFVMCGNCEGSGFVDEDGAPAEAGRICRECDGRGEVLEASTAACNLPRIDTGD